MMTAKFFILALGISFSLSVNEVSYRQHTCNELANFLYSSTALRKYMELLENSERGWATDFHLKMSKYDDRKKCYSKIREAILQGVTTIQGEKEFAISHLYYYETLFGDINNEVINIEFQIKSLLLFEKSADKNYDKAVNFLLDQYSQIIKDEWIRIYAGSTIIENRYSNLELVKMAARWLIRQAEDGNENAMFLAGYIYKYGLGKPINSELAEYWYSLANVQD